MPFTLIAPPCPLLAMHICSMLGPSRRRREGLPRPGPPSPFHASRRGGRGAHSRRHPCAHLRRHCDRVGVARGPYRVDVLVHYLADVPAGPRHHMLLHFLGCLLRHLGRHLSPHLPRSAKAACRTRHGTAQARCSVVMWRGMEIFRVGYVGGGSRQSRALRERFVLTRNQPALGGGGQSYQTSVATACVSQNMGSSSR